MRFIELFAGIGGFRYGLEKSNGQQQENPEVSRCGDSIGNQGKQPNQSQERGNYACVWANELDKYACQIYRKHYGEICEQDIRTVDPSTIPEHDLITAGFPCQSFSIAGKRGGFADTRGTLFFEICRIARAKRTPYLLLENVKGLLSHDNGDTFQTILRTLDELGYDCQWQVLNSKDLGVPQNRERVFIIGHLRGQPRPKVFPIGEINIQDDEREIMREQFDVSGKGYGSQQDRVYDPSGLMACLPNANPDNKLNIFVPQTAQALQTDGQLRQGVSWGTDKPQSARNIRRLTPIECERLQGFPDNWTEGISDTQRYKCLGNAVTTNVIEAIGRQWKYGS